jgi:histone H3/H4
MFERGESMVNKSVVNIGRLFRENAVSPGGRRLHVSSKAIEEWVSRVKDRIEDYVPEICRIAERNGRKTVRVEDVVSFFDIVGRDIV